MDKLKAYLPMIILISGIYVGFKMLPPYFNNWNFSDFCENEARVDTYNTKSEADIKRDVMKSARDNDIPVSEDMVIVQRIGSTGVIISTKYTVHVDLPIRPIDLDFSINTQNKNPVAR